VKAIALLAVAIAVGVTAFVIARSRSGSETAGPATFAEAQSIIKRRCQPCHSLHPTMAGYTEPASGFRLDVPANVKLFAEAIDRRAVRLKEMPLGNATHMTQAERDRLGSWTRAQTAKS
jgi:uncharacterized membrane protein